MKQFEHAVTPVFLAAAAALGLAACGERTDTRTAGERVDSAVTQAEQRWAQAKEQAKEAMNRAGSQAPVALAGGVADSEITATVKAELAKDPQLGTALIDVDTADGRVALRGVAPDAAARERATQIVLAMKGVMGVDNLLRVGRS
jgi:hyperosmotically inducible periplasmic protein